MDNREEEAILPVDECDCEGAECNCENFSLRKSEINMAKFSYISMVVILTFGALLVSVASLVDLGILYVAIILAFAAAFSAVFVMAAKMPENYIRRACTEYKVYYRDIGLPRLKRMYVVLIDVLIAALPLMLFAWGFSHDLALIAARTPPFEEVPFMYAIPIEGWTFYSQGWLDFFLASIGLFLFVIEVVVWFDVRQGQMCSAHFDDVPILALDELDRRAKEGKSDLGARDSL